MTTCAHSNSLRFVMYVIIWFALGFFHHTSEGLWWCQSQLRIILMYRMRIKQDWHYWWYEEFPGELAEVLQAVKGHTHTGIPELKGLWVCHSPLSSGIPAVRRGLHRSKGKREKRDRTEAEHATWLTQQSGADWVTASDLSNQLTPLIHPLISYSWVYQQPWQVSDWQGGGETSMCCLRGKSKEHANNTYSKRKERKKSKSNRKQAG